MNDKEKAVQEVIEKILKEDLSKDIKKFWDEMSKEYTDKYFSAGEKQNDS